MADEEGSDEEKVDRRWILRWAMWGSFVFFLTQFSLGFVNFFWPREVGAFGGEVAAGSVDDYEVGTVTKFADGKFYLVRLEQGFLALYWKCTHLGCTVPWFDAHFDAPDGHFHCPCHGSMFAPDGDNTGGPAPRPMDIMTVNIGDDGSITVDTGDITERATVGPEHFASA